MLGLSYEIRTLINQTTNNGSRQTERRDKKGRLNHWNLIDRKF